jgi:triacylglycerol lipase
MRSGLTGLPIDPKRIGLWGDSAGGGLAAALAILVRDRGEPPLGFLHLIAPMLDDRTVLRPASPHVGRHVWTAAQNAYGWSSYLPMAPGSADVPVYAAAGRAQDLAGLPPTFIACGALDLFIDENLEFARGLMAAGAATDLRVYAGAPHGFWLVRDAAVAKRFRRDALEALARRLAS